MRQKVFNPAAMTRGMTVGPQPVAMLAPQLAPELMNDEYLRALAEDEGRKTTGTAKVGSEEGAKQYGTIREEEWKTALRNLDLNAPPGLEQMRDDLGNARGAFGEYGQMAMQARDQGSAIDLGPLAGLTDSWFGTKLQRGYVPPAERHKADLARMAQLIQKQEQGITGAEADLMRMQLRDVFTSGQQNQLGLTRTATQGTSGQNGDVGLTPYQQESLALRRQGVATQAANRAEDKETAAEAKKKANEDKAYAEVKKLIERKSNTREVYETVSKLGSLVNKYRGRSVPGIGPIENIGGAPGQAIAGVFRGAQEAEDGKEIKRLLMKLNSMRNYELSGKQSTDKEFQRAVGQLGQTFGQDEKQAVSAIREVARIAGSNLEDAYRALTPGAKEVYKNEGLFDPAQFFELDIHGSIRPPGSGKYLEDNAGGGVDDKAKQSALEKIRAAKGKK